MKLRHSYLAAALLLLSVHAVLAEPLAIQRVDDDKFSKEIVVVGPLLRVIDRRSYDSVIRSRVNKKTGAASHQLLVTVSDVDGFAGYVIATDENAEDLQIARVGLIDAYSETVGISLPDAALQSHRAAGYEIKIQAKNGASIVLALSPEQIQVQLDAVDRLIPVAALSPAEVERRAAAANAAAAERLTIQARAKQELDAVQPFLSLAPSMKEHATRAVWFKSVEPASIAEHPAAAVLGIACKAGGKPAVVIGTEFPMKKTWSLTPPLTDVRYYFDADDSHRNWERYSDSEAGPMAFLTGFTESLVVAKVLKVAFEREGQQDRQAVTFRLDDPAQHAKLLALLSACK